MTDYSFRALAVDVNLPVASAHDCLGVGVDRFVFTREVDGAGAGGVRRLGHTIPFLSLYIYEKSLAFGASLAKIERYLQRVCISKS